jgi:hypothetical protein
LSLKKSRSVVQVGCEGTVLECAKRSLMKALPDNVKSAVGTNNSTVEQLMVVMRERTTTLESEQQH